MCEVVNPLQHPQPSPPVSVPLSPPIRPHNQSPPLGLQPQHLQQIPFMFMMATGTGNYSLHNATGNGYPTHYQQQPQQPQQQQQQQAQNCAYVQQSPPYQGQQAQQICTGNPMHTLITGHHPLAYAPQNPINCGTPPPQMISQPATTTIYTLHTIGGSNYFQLQSPQCTQAPLQSPQPGAQFQAQHQQQSSPIPIVHHQQQQQQHAAIQTQDSLDGYFQGTPSQTSPPIHTYHIEVPAHTLRIELGPFKSATELCAEPGDIIEIDRTLFSHWAIYVGNGEVVHIVGSDTQEVPDGERAIVQKLPLIHVAGDCPCRVNNKTLRARERNFLPFHNEIVMRKALSKVGTTVPYNALKCNSEHYVTEWKYGHRWSDQAQFNLNSFKALRRPHANSVTESHQMFVNTLNQVLNSPANSGSSLAGLNSTTSTVTNSNASSLSLSTSPPRRHRQMSVSEQSSTSSPTPPSTSGLGKGGNAFQARLTRAMSASTFSTAVQTELSLL